jgi:hypothetical protein
VNSTEYQTNTKNIKIIFTVGKTETYEDNILVGTEINDLAFKDIIPIIHFQFEKNENNPFSVIPSENLLDLCIALDRNESDISDINHCAGQGGLVA